jgi:hypothetical protein
MYTKYPAKQYLFISGDLNTKLQSQVKIDGATKLIVNNQDVIVGTAANLIACALFWSLFLFIAWKNKIVVQNNKINFFRNTLSTIPCNHCRFSSNNSYLKCAVQPTIAFTDEATNCSDYSPSNSN